MTFLDWVSPQIIFWWIDLSTSWNATKAHKKREGWRKGRQWRHQTWNQVTGEKKHTNWIKSGYLKQCPSVDILRHKTISLWHIFLSSLNSGTLAEHCLSWLTFNTRISGNLKASLYMKKEDEFYSWIALIWLFTKGWCWTGSSEHFIPLR